MEIFPVAKPPSKGYPEVAIGSIQKCKVVHKVLCLIQNFFGFAAREANYIGKGLAGKCIVAQGVVGSAAKTLVLTKIPGTALEFSRACREMFVHKPNSSLSSGEAIVQKGTDLLADSMNAWNWCRVAFQFGALTSLSLIGNLASLVKDVMDFWEATLMIHSAKTIKTLHNKVQVLNTNDLIDVERQEEAGWIKVAKAVWHASLMVMVIVGIIGFGLNPLAILFVSSLSYMGAIWDVVYDDMTKAIKEARLVKTASPA